MPAFYIPTGYFFKDGQVQQPQSARSNPGAEFYVVGTGPNKAGRTGKAGRLKAGAEGDQRGFVKRKLTRGIAARNFLDTGVARVAKELPVQYKNLVNQMFTDSKAAAKVSPVNVSVRAR